MSNKWTIGLISLWVIMTLMSNTLEQQALMGSGEASTLTAFMTPIGADFSNPITAAWSLISNVWHYFKLIIQVIFLYYPTLWQGTALYIYFALFLPISIAFVASIVVMLRGSSSS